jgi:hypothetical protein
MLTLNQKYTNMDEKKSKTSQIYFNEESDHHFLMSESGNKTVKKYASLKVSTIARKLSEN